MYVLLKDVIVLQMLMKKAEAFSRAMEMESKRVKKEAQLVKEKKNGSPKMEDTKKVKNNSCRRS